MVPSCLFMKQPYLDEVSLPLIILNVNLVVLGCIFKNCGELERESNQDGSWAIRGVAPSVVWKTFWVLNSSTYN